MFENMVKDFDIPQLPHLKAFPSSTNQVICEFPHERCLKINMDVAIGRDMVIFAMVVIDSRGVIILLASIFSPITPPFVSECG